MLDTFYLGGIDKKNSIRDILRYIFDKSICFDHTYLEKWAEVSENIDIDAEDDLISYVNEIDFIKSLLKKSEYYADLFRTVFQIGLSDIQHLELTIQQDFRILASISDNLRVRKRPTIAMLNRDHDLRELSLNLSRRINNNTLIVGHPGTGKSFLVETFSLSQQHNILCLNTACLVGGTKYRGEFEEKVSAIFKIISKYRLTVFIDEIHAIVGLGGSDGGIDLNNMLKPVINDPNVRLIGATTEDEYSWLRKDNAFERRFTVMKLRDFSPREASNTFEALLSNVLQYYPEVMNDSCSFTSYLLSKKDTIIALLDRIPCRYYPSKLVDFLDYCTAAFMQNFQAKDVDNCIKTLQHRVNYP